MSQIMVSFPLLILYEISIKNFPTNARKIDEVKSGKYD